MPPLLNSLLLLALFTTTQCKLNDTEIGKAIKDIFKIDNRPGTRRFPETSREGIMYGDQPVPHVSVVHSELKQDTFKVHRSPDGKLNVVFNDLVSLQTEAPYLTPRTPISDSFVYPTSATTAPRISAPPVSVVCKDHDGVNKTYCTEVSNYPKITAVRSDLHSKYASFFGNDLLEPVDITNRMGDDSHEKYLCRSRERIIYPRSGISNKAEEKLIVNDEEFKQGVRIEECIDAGAQCEHMAGLENNYVSECKQHHTARLLVSVTPDGVAQRVLPTKQDGRPNCQRVRSRHRQTLNI